jgi:peptidylprolyl isomerase
MFFLFLCFWTLRPNRVKKSISIEVKGHFSDDGIRKRLIRDGFNQKKPQKDDIVEILWSIYRSDGSLAHNFSNRDDPFDFIVGAQPSNVIPGWETAISQMNEGETSSFYLPSNFAFGEKGQNTFIINF